MVEDHALNASEIYPSIAPKEPDSSLLMWNFYGLHSFHLPYFVFLLWANQALLSPSKSSHPMLQHQCPEVPKRLFHDVSPRGHSTRPARLVTVSATGWALKTTPISPYSKPHDRKWNWSNLRSSSSASPQGCSRSSDTSFGAKHCSRREMARSCCSLIRGHMLYWSPVERFVYPMVRKHAEV